MKNALKFYDTYHKKNDRYFKIISRNNFTYYYFLQTLHSVFSDQQLAHLNVLDIGCGVGTLALYIGQFGAQVLGIDISKRAIEICQKARVSLGMKQVQFKRQGMWKGAAKYDLIICTEIIEHVENDKEFLKRIFQKLKVGGCLVLTTPSKENFLYKIGFYKKFDAEVGHLRRYTKQSIANLLRKEKFTIVEVKPREGIGRNLLFTTKLGIFIKGIKGPLVKLFHFFDELTIPVFGASDLIVIAKKK
jgi:2-polyprenyl-3-methyl-5-hydroxy-6-metoxy-1,4-benzoquinol methylase